MDKLTKVRAEVERLHNEYRDKKGALYFRKALRTVLFIIDSMPKEPVSEQNLSNVQRTVKNWKEHTCEDLEKAAIEICSKVLKGETITIDGYEYVVLSDAEECFKAGANWHKQQMMAKAVDGVITFDYYSGDKTYGCIAHDSFCLEDFGLKDRDKVKVIIIKEE